MDIILHTNQAQEIATSDQSDYEIGQLANEVARSSVFTMSRMGKSANTLSAHKRALKRFEAFLNSVGVQASGLYDSPESWGKVTWGLATAYVSKQLQVGTPLNTLNQHLSVIRSHARLAAQGGFISIEESQKIQAIKGYKAAKQMYSVDAKRRVRPVKEKTTNTLDKKTVKKLNKRLALIDTPAGKRDLLLFELLFRHGLRSSEVLLINRDSMSDGILKFYRPKTGTYAIHAVSVSTIKAFDDLMAICPHGTLLQTNKRSGEFTGSGLTRTTLFRIVRKWGSYIGQETLSAHDARHTLATMIANKRGMTTTRLLDFFGWASMATAQRYIEQAEVGNKGLMRMF